MLSSASDLESKPVCQFDSILESAESSQNHNKNGNVYKLSAVDDAEVDDNVLGTIVVNYPVIGPGNLT